MPPVPASPRAGMFFAAFHVGVIFVAAAEALEDRLAIAVPALPCDRTRGTAAR